MALNSCSNSPIVEPVQPAPPNYPLNKFSLSDQDFFNQLQTCFQNVFQELGCGFRESIYRKALCLELQSLNCIIHEERYFPIFYKKNCIGHVIPDLVIEVPHTKKLIVIELKSVLSITLNMHMQAKCYFKIDPSVFTVFLVNFGKSKLDIIQY